ncbi:lytic transglycosylase domain-containing protein [Acidithiobacillus sp. 'AMD consortium']|uniref:lytic transglycosylase domain-containing protein n=1 Tax=Acidithiobacillus sp. 'AMD consortium' TaxID=2614801 RepID=UPI00124F6F4A|nr:lytic transglycosylase domain-containing protein [Acidithiobacillus sp. 'AMD consortium']QFG79266.1 lytic transglycosylase domain-containing protein [Acidithiobacillus sp. 'AMD consortium']
MIHLLPPYPLTPVHRYCVAAAAERYHVPVGLLYGILATEDTRVGQTVHDANGSYDMGPMGINSLWLSVLAHYGITRPEVLDNGCQNVAVGAWILARKLAGHPSRAQAFAHPRAFWRHVGDYNSAIPHWNHQYRQRVAKFAQQDFYRPLERASGGGHP